MAISWFRQALLAAGIITALIGACPLFAQESLEERVQRLEKHAEMLEKQNAMLLKLLKDLPSSAAPEPPALGREDVRQIISTYLQEKDAQKKTADEAKQQESPASRDDRTLKTTWDDGGFRYKSSNGDFNLHLGGRLMTDDVWWRQSPNLQKPATQPPGSNLGTQTGLGPGIGELLDGFFVRRARFVADGTVYKTIEFKVEFDFENYNSISFDESYIGAKNLPFIDTVRVGQTHVPFGLEAYTSSRFLPMLERSPLFDAFYQEFAPGIFTNTTFFDQRLTTQHMFHRIDNFVQFNGASFGNDKYAYSGRISGLPIYENEGHTLLHLGLAYQWRNGSNPSDFNGGTTLASFPKSSVTDNTDLVRFRSRPSLRDAVGLQGNGVRIVDTGNIIADDVQALNGELLAYYGPFWAQSETCLAHVDNAVFPASAAGTARGSLNYYGSYIQIGYFLTGESRGYDKRFGKYGRVVPLTNFSLARSEDGRIAYGPGAWELVYRYGYLNLNDNAILGGVYSEHTVGLNWYWNPNIKFQINYITGQRYALPAGVDSGTVQGFAIRGALEF